MKVDINKIIKPYRIAFKIIGVWPGVTGWSGFIFSTGSLAFSLIFMIWDAFIVYYDFELLINNLVNTVGCIMGLLKLLIFRVERRNIEFMIKVIFNDWNIEIESANGIMAKNLIRSRYVCNMFLISYNLMCASFVGKALFSYIFNEVQDRQFIVQSYFPINATVSPIYEIIFLLHTLALASYGNSNAVIESFLAALALHSSTKMDAVRREIINYSNICRVKKYDKQLAIQHLKILWFKHLQYVKFAESIPDIFFSISFYNITFVTMMQVLLTTLFVNILSDALSIFSLHYLACIMACIINTGYYCIIGEYLTHQSKLIFDYLYECPWYEFQTSNVKALTFMLMRARKPVYLTFGKFNVLSLEFLTTIYKTTFSYFSLLRAVH